MVGPSRQSPPADYHVFHTLVIEFMVYPLTVSLLTYLCRLLVNESVSIIFLFAAYIIYPTNIPVEREDVTSLFHQLPRTSFFFFYLWPTLTDLLSGRLIYQP